MRAESEDLGIESGKSMMAGTGGGRARHERIMLGLNGRRRRRSPVATTEGSHHSRCWMQYSKEKTISPWITVEACSLIKTRRPPYVIDVLKNS